MGYRGIHQWMNRHYPKTGRCERCGCTDKRTDYASVSHDVYTLNRADWFELCKFCHQAFDGKTGKQPPGLAGAPIQKSAEHRAKIAATLRARTHCKRGHEFTTENTIIRAHGWRECRTCYQKRLREARV